MPRRWAGRSTRRLASSRRRSLSRSRAWVPAWSTFTYFRPGRRGTLVVKLERTGYHGDAPPGRALLTTGTVKLVNQQAKIAKIVDQRRVIVENGSSQVIKIPVARTPVRLVLTFPTTNTFHAGSDQRDLAAQASFSFVPEKQG